MAGPVYKVAKLLLFCFTCVKGEEGLISAEQVYTITFPCEEKLVCFHIWHLSSHYIALVTNGEMQAAVSEDKDSECTLPIKDLLEKDVGKHHCKKEPAVFSPRRNRFLQINLLPGKTASLQCVLFTYVKLKRCGGRLTLRWVDEGGHEIQPDSHHQITRESSCAITLTVTFQSPQTRTFRCQASADEETQTSAEVKVRVPGPKGSRRGSLIVPDEKMKVGKRNMIGTAVGVVGGVVLSALVAAFVVKRRRTSNQPAAASHTTSSNNVMNPEDVIYADIILPADPSRVWIHEDESCEYACVRHK